MTKAQKTEGIPWDFALVIKIQIVVTPVPWFLYLLSFRRQKEYLCDTLTTVSYTGMSKSPIYHGDLTCNMYYTSTWTHALGLDIASSSTFIIW